MSGFIQTVRFTGEQKTPRKSIQSNWIFELKQQTMGKIGHYTHNKYISLNEDQYVAVHVYRHKPIGGISSGSKSNAPNKQSVKGPKTAAYKGKKLY